MVKNKRDIVTCEYGDILAENIVDNVGQLLIKESTIIDKNIKMKLMEMGVQYIYVYKNQESEKEEKIMKINDIYEKDRVIIKRTFERLSQGEMLETREANEILDGLFEKIVNEPFINNYLTDLYERDSYTYIHSLNVGYYCMVLGKYLKFSHYNMGEIIKAGVLHDIGKIKIPLKLLNKKEKLSKEEFEIIKLHPLLGYDIVKNADSISEDVKLAVLMHHEKENGSGYPNGLKGQDIPLYAKICAIADIYDALTTNRAYKKKITPTHAFKILRSMAGDHLNVELLLIFLENAYRCYF